MLLLSESEGSHSVKQAEPERAGEENNKGATQLFEQ
jgi:hypothetical protein